MPHQIITDSDELASFAEELAKEPAIAVDLEADSMHNYQEKVCLLQFTTSKRTVLVDPLAVNDLSCLQTVFADPSVRKIFHAADYDIRSLYRDFKIKVKGLFDTMVCCQFLGEEKVGLAAILNKYFGVTLNKKFQRADWSKRPLPDGMVSYAAADTQYLHQLAAILENKIQQKNRQKWVAEEFALLEKVRHNTYDGPLFMKVKEARGLSGHQLAALEGLLQWRDQEAYRQNRPHFKVIDTKCLVTIVKLDSTNIADLETIPLPKRLLEKNAHTWLKIIKQAHALPKENLPFFPVYQRAVYDQATSNRLKALKKWRTGKAHELSIDPGIMINTALLEEIANKPPNRITDLDQFATLKNWQRSELSQGIIRAVKGDN